MSDKVTRFLRWQYRQLHWRQVVSVLWWSGLLHLCSFIPLLYPHSEHRLQHLCRCAARLLRWYAVVSSGCYHDVLPFRKLQG